MSPRFDDLIAPFINSISSGQIEIYNEFSLQHELGFFLRTQLPNCKVQFERNVRSLFPSQNSFVKREIDIVLTDRNADEHHWAIELKYPRNGQYPMPHDSDVQRKRQIFSARHFRVTSAQSI
jgi:hypothetical protein